MVCISWILPANNIQIANISMTGKNTVDQFILVQFDLSWENSWRTSAAPGNMDAAWVFIKYRIRSESGGDGIWKHAWLDHSGHSAGTGTPASIEAGLLDPASAFNAAANPALGSFFFRSSEGSGNFSITGAALRWNYGANGVTNSDIVEIQVFAVEMVYVPSGAFAAGSGGGETNAFTLTTINTTNPMAVPSGTGSFGGSAGGYPTGQTAPDNVSWPNGYNSFYSMKYEISQQQYVDFLNTLSQQQADNRKYTGSSNRYAITGSAAGSYETTNPYVACNFLNWMDGAAYADWAGLRPMTELEFEKACRGTIAPVANEYAWGMATVAGGAYTFSNNGLVNESISGNYSVTNGNASYGPTISDPSGGPVRVGIFSANPGNSGRVSAGAGYWGIMELSGNVREQTVSLGHADGRSFTGGHGNGLLDGPGQADVTAWPGFSSGAVSGADGSGFRGGSFQDGTANRLRVSDRESASAFSTNRNATDGFRAVRTAPFVCGMSAVMVSHVAGFVAPVNKTVTYGTVTNLPGEPAKCWITQNLGAGRQATSVSDTSEASAGWYWQFNRKKGYKHNGTDVTPSWPTASISEFSDWQKANDPCNLELGNNWRIPTASEWSNVISAGNWVNWNDAWSSGLKLHGSGMVFNGSGSLLFRGTGGYFWSSSQRGTTNSFGINILNIGIDTTQFGKADGFSIRCIRTSQTYSSWTCGDAFSVDHSTTGGVAPVAKSVYYGTVPSLPGEPSKCWITQNLGADREATAVDDATDASAGWYWQFNRKMGYNLNGTSLAPSWTITSISENSDWLADNDPCSIELGSSWRIPTFTEWTNVKTSGNWNNWNNAWNSGLKLHGSGLLLSNDGSVLFRGTGGYHWSSTQNNVTQGEGINVLDGGVDLNNFSKADGFSLRCLFSLQP